MRKIVYTLIISFLFLFGLNACLSSGATPGNAKNALPQISLVPLKGTALPGLNHANIAYYNGYWLILGGQTAGFHAFNYSTANQNIYVYNPSTNQMYFESIGNTDLPESVQQQLTSLAQIRNQDGDTIYLVGGYYNSPGTKNYTTLQIISSFNIPGIINAVINHSESLNQYVNYSTDNPIFKLTGGGMSRINNDFYLAFGQDCEGYYCNTAQLYSNSIYQLRFTPDLESITLINYLYSQESSNSGFRRRDYSIAPIVLGNVDSILALGGPFTSGTPYPWTNVIAFDKDLNYTNSFLNQQANQYDDAILSIHSSSNNTSYVATFGGLSSLYWSKDWKLTYDNTWPYGNVLELIRYDGNSKTVNDFANTKPLCSGYPLESCQYNGADAQFIRSNDTFYDYRDVLDIDRLSGPTLVGYVYGGIVSDQQDIFVTPPVSTASSQIFAVYVTPQGSNDNWINITNAHPATPYNKYSSGF